MGLNRAEVMFRTGHYLTDPVAPQALGYEAAGTVESVGPGVTELAVGHAVSVVPAFTMTEYAAHGELVLAPSRAVVTHQPIATDGLDQCSEPITSNGRSVTEQRQGCTASTWITNTCRLRAECGLLETTRKATTLCPQVAVPPWFGGNEPGVRD